MLAHNFYRSSAPSGEDVVFSNERDLLERNGVQTISYEKYNDRIDDGYISRLALGVRTAWSEHTYEEVAAVIRRERPDIAHFHNTLPQISPSAYAACKDNGVAVVQTLHNYRLICPGALLLRNNRPCEDCVATSLLPALRYRCYRQSFSATAAVVWMLTLNRWRQTYNRLVDRYLALSRFQAARLIAGGLPPQKIRIKPNFVTDDVPPTARKDNYAVYVGRLSADKGLRTLLQAWRQLPNLPLKIIGSGPLEQELKAYADAHHIDASFYGFLPKAQLPELVGRALVQVVPSECYETFGLVVIEAHACGTAVVASDIGGLPEVIRDDIDGRLFKAGDANDLVENVRYVVAEQERYYGAGAPRLLKPRFTQKFNFRLTMRIYGEVLRQQARQKAQTLANHAIL
jgi:glycosyltransferase involved in cell wall biosynthesis